MTVTLLGHVRTCSNCGRRRKVNCHWQDTGIVLCRECSHLPDLVWNLSHRPGGAS